MTGAHLGPADVPPWRSVIDSETTDLHGSTCELHAVLVMTSSIRLIRASRMRKAQHDWAGRPNRQSRRRSATYIATYQDRLSALAELARPCLVIGFGLDTDTHAARAREVAEALSEAQYVELAGLVHAAPISHPDQVWPAVIDLLRRFHPPCIAAATGSGVPGPIRYRSSRT